MGANLYFMSGDRAVGMSEHRYDSEDILQKIIADNPGLLLRDADPDGSRQIGRASCRERVSRCV